MTPLSQELTFEGTSTRNDDCAFYNSCLDKAANQRLESFSCSGCEDYIKTRNLRVEDYLVRQDETPLDPPGNMGNWKLLRRDLSLKMKENGISMSGFKEGQRKF